MRVHPTGLRAWLFEMPSHPFRAATRLEEIRSHLVWPSQWLDEMCAHPFGMATWPEGMAAYPFGMKARPKEMGVYLGEMGARASEVRVRLVGVRADPDGIRDGLPRDVGSRVPAQAWERVWHLYSLNRETFLRHYHQRSNVESTFSALKRKSAAVCGASCPPRS